MIVSVSSMGILTYRSYMSYVISWRFLYSFNFVISVAKFVEFLTLYWYLSVRCRLSNLTMCLATL